MRVFYVGESGESLGEDHYRPNTDPYRVAQRLPTPTRAHQCLSCGVTFGAHPGEAICPSCGHLYCRCLDA